MGLLLIVSPALAAEKDTYWQRLEAGRAAQCSQELVDLAKALDDAKAEIEQLKKRQPEQPDK